LPRIRMSGSGRMHEGREDSGAGSGRGYAGWPGRRGCEGTLRGGSPSWMPGRRRWAGTDGRAGGRSGPLTWIRAWSGVAGPGRAGMRRGSVLAAAVDTKSPAKLAAELRPQGHRAVGGCGGDLLREEGFSLQGHREDTSRDAAPGPMRRSLHLRAGNASSGAGDPVDQCGHQEKERSATTPAGGA